MKNMIKADGTVRVVFATVSLGMGVDFARLNSVEDYFKNVEGLGGQENSLIQPDATKYKDTSNDIHKEEIVRV